MKRSELIFNKEKTVKNSDTNIFFNLIFERKNSRPLAYVLGESEFMGITVKVSEGVLIPRDDTEVLVRESTKLLKENEFYDSEILDLCSGTGIVALAMEKILSKNIKNLEKFLKITAVEVSDIAVKILRENIVLNNSNIKILHGDIFKIHKQFKESSVRAIVINPPYIETSVISTLDSDVQKEPKIALDGGETGLNFYKILSEKWFDKLEDDGFIAMEVGYNQSDKVSKIFSAKSNKIEIKRDINGINRVVIVKK